MTQPRIDPTFYRTASEAAAAPGEQLAYVAAFDRAAQKSDAMTVVDVNSASDTYGRGRLDRRPRASATSCTTSAGTPAAARLSMRATTWKASPAAICWCQACARRASTCSTTPGPTLASRRWSRRLTARALSAKAGYSRPQTLPLRTRRGLPDLPGRPRRATTTDRAASHCSTTRASTSCAPGRPTAGHSTSNTTPGGTSTRTC